ncbi:cytochrome P450 [Cyathus striatus]|nr:cytochrome P450 [Cyathus striatus]
MSSTISAALTLLALAILYHILQSNSSNPINIPYPPGPKGIFLTQNLLDIPKSRAWFTYTSWKKKYGLQFLLNFYVSLEGNLIFLQVLGQNILVLQSHKDAIALFEKDQGSNPIVLNDGMGLQLSRLKYSNKWRKHRKLYQQFLHSPLAHTFHPIQCAKIHAILKDLLNDRHNVKNHSRRCSSAIIMKMIYNIDVSPSPKRDICIEVAEAADTNLCLLTVPSAIFANIFPLIHYIPTWFPVIGSIKRILLEMSELMHWVMSVIFDVILKNPDPASGVAMRLLAYSRSRGANPTETVSAMGTFFLAMLTSPNIQLKAQNEIDNDIGTTRLPEYDNRESLLYVEAIFREVMRWNPVLPLADIPKGTIVIQNMWYMNHFLLRYEISHLDSDEVRHMGSLLLLHEKHPHVPTTGPAYSVSLQGESHTVNITGSWTRTLMIHHIAAMVTVIGLLLSLSSHATFTIITAIVSFTGAIITLIALVCNSALYAWINYQTNEFDSSSTWTSPGPVYWLILISCFLLFFAGIIGISCYKKRSSDRKEIVNKTPYPLTLRKDIYSKSTLV